MAMKENNRESYNAKAVVNWYANLSELTAIEKSVFKTYEGIITEANLLDIGIGGGRTTQYLVSKAKNYTGIDYALEFVKHAKHKFPEADIRLMDARDLSSFKDNTFDFVNFSFNGIDYVDLKNRVKILNEVNRVLKPNGVFFFSTHNKSHSTFNKLPWRNNRNSLYTNIKTFIKLAPFLPVHNKKKSEEVYNADYAIVNDSAHNFSLMTFYTSPQFLKEQLVTSKFSDIEMFLKNGNRETDEKLDDWIFAVCKKLTT